MPVNLPNESDLGVLRTRGGLTYQLTRDDILWMARAAKYEGGDHAATFWTWAQRFAIRFRFSGTFAGMIRAHSQPVNPAWDESTDAKCLQYPERCTSAHLARRLAARTASWASLGDVADLAVAWAQARVSNPAPQATDFADAQVSRSFLERNPDARVVRVSGNWYIAEAAALALPANEVSVVYKGRVATASGRWELPVAGVLGFMVGAAAIRAFTR